MVAKLAGEIVDAGGNEVDLVLPWRALLAGDAAAWTAGPGDFPRFLGPAGNAALEELSRADAAVGVLVDVQNTLVNNAIERNGTPEQKTKYLTRTSADTVASYCLSEAGSGSDAFALQCRAVASGDHYVLNGQKLWITNAAEAGSLLTMPIAHGDGRYTADDDMLDRLEGEEGRAVAPP